MNLIEIKETDRKNYNLFVAASESGSFLQSWEWGEWQSALDREVVRLKITDESGAWVGSVQLIKMGLWGKKYYWYAPYGPIVDLRFKIEDIRFLTQELQKKFPDAVFIRIEPKDKSFIFNPSSFTQSHNIQPGKTLIIDLSKIEEQLLAEMHPKTRYNIKLAQKHGVEIKDEFNISIGHGLFFEEALKLILETSKRQGFKTFDQSYYRKFVDFFAVQNRNELKLHIYKAIYQNQLLSSAIMVDFGSVRTFLFGGSSDANKNVMAPYLLHWRAMLDAKTKGLKFYDFWGIETSSGETPGFVRFKLGFLLRQGYGGQVGGIKEYAGAYDMIVKPWLYKIYRLLRFVNRLRR